MKLRPAAVKAGIIEDGQKVRFGFHNFRHSLASALVKMKVDPKTVQEFLRQAHVTTTLQLYTQSDMESKRDAQGMFLKQMARRQDAPAHGANSVITLGGEISTKSCNCFEMWWPGTELNRRRQPFQCFVMQCFKQLT